MGFEARIIEFLQGGRTPFFDVAFQVISLVGSYVGAVALVIFFLIFKRRYAFFFLLTYGFTYLVQSALKNHFMRERPFNAYDTIVSIGDKVTSFSMPSGHTICAVLIAMFLGFYLFSVMKGRGARALITVSLVVYVLLVMLSRMYLGKHYLTDVLAGAGLGMMMGALGLLLLIFTFKKDYVKKKEPKKENK